jgi:hypothetical protein
VKKKDAYDKGIAEAIKVLIELFLTKYKTEFNPTYLACFYRGIEEVLQKNTYLMDVVLTSSQQFFQHELKGSRILIPAYLKAIVYVFREGKKLQGIQSRLSVLRGACITILGYFMSLRNNFVDIRFPVKEKGLVADYSEVSLPFDLVEE